MSEDKAPEKKKKLGAKQRAFVREYVRDWNGTQAAIRAGYSEKTAHAIAWENLRKPEIQEEIEKLVAAHTMTAAEALVRMTSQARADLGPYLHRDAETGRMYVDVDQLVADGLGYMIKSVSLRQTIHGQQVKVELHDAQAALKLIGTHHRLFVEQTELSVRDGEALPIQVVDYRNAIAALAPGPMDDSE